MGYLRVSTEEQSLGAEAQKAAVTAWAQRQGVAIASWHEDRLSGGTAPEDRPGLVAALQALRTEGAGLLVAARRDRIARDVVVAATIERLALDAGALVATADGVSLEATPEGALMRGLLDLFASYERSVIRARTKAALAAKRARGERVAGRPPLGFRYEAGRLIEDASEKALLGRAREMRTRGLSLARIAQVLTAQGVRLRGGRIHPTTLSRALGRVA